MTASDNVVAADIVRKHKWGEPAWLSPDKTVSSCEEIVRQCDFCGLSKITVHPKDGRSPYRLWRSRDGVESSGAEPLCNDNGGAP